MKKHRVEKSSVRPDRFEKLYERHASEVLAYARRRTDTDTAEDIAAEVFATAWRRIDDVPEGAALPWLYGTARNVLANEIRARRRRHGLAERAAAAVRTQSMRGEDSDRSEDVLAALGKLNVEEQEVLMLTAWEELDGRQAAVVLGCSPTAYRIRLHRARRKLRQQLAAEQEPPEAVRLNPHVEEMS
jgi:RNA polymerase sigma-70 factor (ECF subfamily)